MSKNPEWVANSADPDQMTQKAASDLGLHCLLSLRKYDTNEKHQYIDS